MICKFSLEEMCGKLFIYLALNTMKHPFKKKKKDTFYST